MPQAYVIEIRSQTAGIVVHDGRRFYFYASSPAFGRFEGQPFRSPGDAEKVLRRHAATMDRRGLSAGGN